MLDRSVTAVDRLALRRVVRGLPQVVGRPVTWLGHSATGGGIWFASAAALSACGRRGRRGAGLGLVAYSATSALANGPAKWLARRPRPGGAALLGLRRRGRAPDTSSFPSSHTAAAVAFAVAASAELPAAAPLLVPAAAGVALSRLRAVRHYPSDVAAGALLGAAVGAVVAGASRRRNRRGGPGASRRGRVRSTVETKGGTKEGT